jgi:SPX domain protein involved in polyphosphate accumulation
MKRSDRGLLDNGGGGGGGGFAKPPSFTEILDSNQSNNLTTSNGSMAPITSRNSSDSNAQPLLMPLEMYNKYSKANLNVILLNEKLNMVKKRNRELETRGLRRVNSTMAFQNTRSFAEELDYEVEKIVLFYLNAQGEIAKALWKTRENQMQSMTKDGYLAMTNKHLDEFCEKYRDLGVRVVCLLNYLEFNVEELRKVVKRHDLLFEQKMGSVYFDTRKGGSYEKSQLVQLESQEVRIAVA